MPVGLVGKKCGMTRIFTKEGLSIPVTVIEVKPNYIAQVKTVEKDCYRALQLAVADPDVKSSRVNKPTAGHLAKASVAPAVIFHEFRLDQDEYGDAKSGDQLSVEMFKEGQYVDVQGVSKGKGFAGGIKRHGFRRQDETHGNSLSHRAPGSIGQNQTPGRVFKGKKMAGRMGNVNRTIQNQQVIKIDTQRQLIMVKGAIPGAPGGVVIINHAVKKREK